MNEETANKLKNNPHYQMTAKQKREAREFDKKPMRKFGDVETHDATPEIHKPQVKRSKSGKKSKKS